jgi:hypothetical protein
MMQDVMMFCGISAHLIRRGDKCVRSNGGMMISRIKTKKSGRKPTPDIVSNESHIKLPGIYIPILSVLTTENYADMRNFRVCWEISNRLEFVNVLLSVINS